MATGHPVGSCLQFSYPGSGPRGLVSAPASLGEVVSGGVDALHAVNEKTVMRQYANRFMLFDFGD